MELYKSAGLNTLNHLQILVALVKVIEIQTFKYVSEHFIAITSTAMITLCTS